MTTAVQMALHGWEQRGFAGTIERIRIRVIAMLIDEEFTLKKLEIFLAFMRTGNLARAAAELQTSNVSVHRAIHSLENALRCPDRKSVV